MQCDDETFVKRKWRDINISDQNSRLNHISDKLTLGPVEGAYV